MKISRSKASNLINNSKGKFLSVTFVKKDGTKRVLVGRTGVHSSPNAPLKGKGLRYNPSNYNLITLFDAHKKAYRMVNVGTLTEVKSGGETYTVEGDN